MSKAVIGKPAPAFKAQAIVDGEIKEISLSDYKGASRFAREWARSTTTTRKTFSKHRHALLRHQGAIRPGGAHRRGACASNSTRARLRWPRAAPK
jgi:hypothetical protein